MLLLLFRRLRLTRLIRRLRIRRRLLLRLRLVLICFLVIRIHLLRLVLFLYRRILLVGERRVANDHWAASGVMIRQASLQKLQ